MTGTSPIRASGVTLGDVMGKGLPAAIMMATVRAALRGSAGLDDMEEGVNLAAKVMATALEVNHAYVTLFHAVRTPRQVTSTTSMPDTDTRRIREGRQGRTR